MNEIFLRLNVGHGDDIIPLNTHTQNALELKTLNVHSITVLVMFPLSFCPFPLFRSTGAVCVMTLIVHLVSSLMECTIPKFYFALHSVITVASCAGAFYQPLPGSDFACLGNCCFGLNSGR
jgi:hypothetical protein